ncbi:putative transmembrane protein [Toxoplasma gondii TgCatPRC2]|uniref:Putative transmembrane protein n=1 Tax=Toxoplasma gondii TgCatPRC2 TaxID=1130821 RepID=A0A151HDP4_TOXGO|nr:putative transmembrane protein [Toxoplasma gondii TgCatPRC2]
MNVTKALGLSKVLPSEQDLPSLPKVDTKKKRKDARKPPALPHRPTQGGGSRASAKKSSWAFVWGGKETPVSELPAVCRDRDGNAAALSTELDELVALCQSIEAECLVTAPEECEEERDEFLAVKKRMEDTLKNTYMLIEERRTIRAAKGTTLETVRLGGEIDDNLSLLRDLFEEISAVYRQQFKQRKKKKLTDADLEERHADINRLMRAIEELRRESKRTAVAAGPRQNQRLRTLSEIASGTLGLSPGVSSEGPLSVWGEAVDEGVGAGEVGGPFVEEVSREDRETIRRWKERDEEFDKQVAEIGEAIDRIAHVAVQIGDKAEVHHELIQQVQTHTEQAAAEIQVLNAKVKGLLSKQSNATFFTRLLLIVILLFLVCFVLSIVYARYIKRA